MKKNLRKGTFGVLPQSGCNVWNSTKWINQSKFIKFPKVGKPTNKKTLLSNFGDWYNKQLIAPTLSLSLYLCTWDIIKIWVILQDISRYEEVTDLHQVGHTCNYITAVDLASKLANVKF